MAIKPRLTLWQIINMNVGFFGIQYSFGLQQSNMSPIYKYLGASEAELPYLWLAGPMTGLLVQPIIGAMSDRTLSRWGRRTPYFLVGAILCSLSLLAMPFSSALWMAASILWILDAANNVTMEPYRAYVNDRLPTEQVSSGYLVQSAFTGLGQTLAYLTPTIFVLAGLDQTLVNGKNIPYITVAAFIVGSVFSITSVLWSVRTTPELPLTEVEREKIRLSKGGIGPLLKEIAEAFRDMPLTMKQLAVVKLFQWYAMFCYWQYIQLSIAQTFFGTTDEKNPQFTEAGLIVGQIGGFYNLVAFIAALIMVGITRKTGPKIIHSISLLLAATAMLILPEISHRGWILLPMIGIGIAWASMMGNPYVMLAGSIPRERTGVYMGIFNMFIVIPMMIQVFTLPLLYQPVLGGDPRNVIRLAGGLLLLASVAVLFVKVVKNPHTNLTSTGGGGH